MSGNEQSKSGEPTINSEILVKDFLMSPENATKLMVLFDANKSPPPTPEGEMLIKIVGNQILLYDPSTKKWNPMESEFLEPIGFDEELDDVSSDTGEAEIAERMSVKFNQMGTRYAQAGNPQMSSFCFAWAQRLSKTAKSIRARAGASGSGATGGGGGASGGPTGAPVRVKLPGTSDEEEVLEPIPFDEAEESDVMEPIHSPGIFWIKQGGKLYLAYDPASGPTVVFKGGRWQPLTLGGKRPGAGRGGATGGGGGAAGGPAGAPVRVRLPGTSDEEEDVMEPITPEQEILKALKKLLMAAKIPIPKVLEPIGVDEGEEFTDYTAEEYMARSTMYRRMANEATRFGQHNLALRYSAKARQWAAKAEGIKPGVGRTSGATGGGGGASGGPTGAPVRVKQPGTSDEEDYEVAYQTWHAQVAMAMKKAIQFQQLANRAAKENKPDLQKAYLVKVKRWASFAERITHANSDNSWDSIDGENCKGSIAFTIDKASIVVKDGKLTGPCIMSAAMVQDYEGTPVLKCPDELKLSVASAKQLPITDGHPIEKVVVSPDEIKGWTSVPTWNDEKKRIECSVEITDEALIKKIVDEGKTSVSIGFTCQLDPKEGKFNDTPYKFIQRKMLLNHLATGVDSGRCPTPKCGIGAEGDAPAPTHEALLKEKLGILGEFVSKLTAGAMTWSPKMFREEWDKVWDLQRGIVELMAVVSKDGKDTTDATVKVTTMKDSALALKQLHLSTVKLVDIIMDSTPEKPREFYDALTRKELDSLISVMGSKPRSHSKPAGDAISEAYEGIAHRRHGKN